MAEAYAVIPTKLEEQGATDHVCPPEFCGLAFPIQFLAPGEDYDLTAFGPFAPAGDFVGSVKQIIAALMVDGRCHLNLIAEALGMRARTLQRNLSECRSDYSELLAEVRCESAVRLLDDPRVKVIDIAFQLGYADPANFTRAFRHWTGVSPSNFRRRRRESGQGTAALVRWCHACRAVMNDKTGQKPAA